MNMLSRCRQVASAVTLTGILVFAGSCQAESDCQITLSKPVIDLKTLRKDEVIKSAQGWNQLQEQDINVSVFCPTSRNMAVFFGGRAGEKGRFKFGTQSGLSVNVSHLTLDGQRYEIARTQYPGNFSSFDSVAETQQIHSQQGIIAVSGNAVAPGQQMNFTLTLTPLLKDVEFMVTDKTTLSTGITLAVIDN
ncbi:hypothetical protein MUU48_01125 [Scandinavium sp. H11S7]|uniref:Uncharacterized protein n=1 Tax=Scandinavium hiltneri TaxID=2926519 RepID=A0ABT2DW05_9ENTR|nr:hypothetical protein [Scandinavium hiltneri]MCS2155563.1 hypothetical protein [Scandinavium hiltneri]MCS2159801.1 hypothetical protein [Scandinavium hiltneri]